MLIAILVFLILNVLFTRIVAGNLKTIGENDMRAAQAILQALQRLRPGSGNQAPQDRPPRF